MYYSFSKNEKSHSNKKTLFLHASNLYFLWKTTRREKNIDGQSMSFNVHNFLLFWSNVAVR